MSTSEKPANIMARTLTDHFLGTMEAESTARAGKLIKPTKVAATICQVLSPGFNQLGYGTCTMAPSTRLSLLVSCCPPSHGAVSRRPVSGYSGARRRCAVARGSMNRRHFRTVTPVLRARELPTIGATAQGTSRSLRYHLESAWRPLR